MKKITSILMLFLMCFGMAVQAAGVLPEITTDPSQPKWYSIKSFRSHKYLGYDNSKMKVAQLDNVAKESLWYILKDETSDAVYLCNGLGQKLTHDFQLTDSGSKWYILTHDFNVCGISICKNPQISGSDCIDDQNGNVGFWSPSATDNEGTSWEFVKFDSNAELVKYDQTATLVRNVLSAKNAWTKSNEVRESLGNSVPGNRPADIFEVMNCNVAMVDALRHYEDAPCIFDESKNVFFVSHYGKNMAVGQKGETLVVHTFPNFIDETSLWTLLPQVEAGEGVYKIFNKVHNKYIGSLGSFKQQVSMPIVEQATAANYLITSKVENGKEKLIFTDKAFESRYNKLHAAGDGSVVYWESCSASYWNAELEEELGSNLVAKFKSTMGCVGSYTAAQIAEMESINDIASYKAFVNSNKPIEFDSNKLYRIKNYMRMLNPQGGNSNWDRPGHGGYIGTTPYKSNQTELTCGTDQLNDAGTVWQLVKNGEEGYYLKNLNNGKYVGHNGNQTDKGGVAMFETTADAGTYKLESVGNAQYKLDVKGNKLHVSTGKFMYYDNNDPASRWYLIPATELEVNLNAAGEATWTSLYLPFDVTLPAELEAYTGSLNGNTLSMNKVAEVPANNGVILKGQATTYNLTINGNSGKMLENNSLKGTNVKMDNVEKANFYILGNGAAGVGLYNPNTTTLKANKAYVEAGVAAQVLKFDFNGETTGVEGVEVETENAKAVYYDLSGRRVANPAKGVYVKNGKKVFVK